MICLIFLNGHLPISAVKSLTCKNMWYFWFYSTTVYGNSMTLIFVILIAQTSFLLQIKVDELLWKLLDMTFLLIHSYPFLHILSNCTMDSCWYRGGTHLRIDINTLPKIFILVKISDSFSSSLFIIDLLTLSSICLQNALFTLAHKHSHSSPKMPLWGQGYWWSWASRGSTPLHQ